MMASNRKALLFLFCLLSVVVGAEELTMKRILNYLATAGSFLYEEHEFVIFDSEYIDSFGGTGFVTLDELGNVIRVNWRWTK